MGEDGLFRDVERGRRLRKGGSEMLRLCPWGDAEPGLQQGCAWAPHGCGRQVGCAGAGGHSPRLQLRGVAGGGRLEPVRSPTWQVRGLASEGGEAG